MVKKLGPYQNSTDMTPQYTVKDVAELMGVSAYTIRYYENEGLIPGVARSKGNIRLFSEHTLSWLRVVHCLRTTGLSIEGVKHYINLCLKGDSTIPERAELLAKQEKNLKQQIKTLREQMDILKYKQGFYKKLMSGGTEDLCNPAVRIANRKSAAS